MSELLDIRRKEPFKKKLAKTFCKRCKIIIKAHSNATDSPKSAFEKRNIETVTFFKIFRKFKLAL